MTLPFDSRGAAADASEALFARTGIAPAALDDGDPGHRQAAIQQVLCESTPHRIGLFRSVADLRLCQVASGAIGR